MFADRCEFHMGKTLDNRAGYVIGIQRCVPLVVPVSVEGEKPKSCGGWEGAEPRKSDRATHTHIRNPDFRGREEEEEERDASFRSVRTVKRARGARVLQIWNGSRPCQVYMDTK